MYICKIVFKNDIINNVKLSNTFLPNIIISQSIIILFINNILDFDINFFTSKLLELISICLSKNNFDNQYITQLYYIAIIKLLNLLLSSFQNDINYYENLFGSTFKNVFKILYQNNNMNLSSKYLKNFEITNDDFVNLDKVKLKINVLLKVLNWDSFIVQDWSHNYQIIINLLYFVNNNNDYRNYLINKLCDVINTNTNYSKNEIFTSQGIEIMFFILAKNQLDLLKLSFDSDSDKFSDKTFIIFQYLSNLTYNYHQSLQKITNYNAENNNNLNFAYFVEFSVSYLISILVFNQNSNFYNECITMIQNIAIDFPIYFKQHMQIYPQQKNILQEKLKNKIQNITNVNENQINSKNKKLFYQKLTMDFSHFDE